MHVDCSGTARTPHSSAAWYFYGLMKVRETLNIEHRGPS